MWRVTIEEMLKTEVAGLQGTPAADVVIKRYFQEVDAIDLRAVMAAVNNVKRRRKSNKTERKSES